MRSNKICKHCKCEFVDIEGKVFSNHVRWCSANPNLDKLKNSENIRIAVNKRYDATLGCLLCHDVVCHKCERLFQVMEREYSFPTKQFYFCSRGCANFRIFSDESKKKKSDALKGMHNGKLIILQKRFCLFCNANFDVHMSSKKKFCTTVCYHNYTRRDITDKELYRKCCQFKFNVYHYPDKFNLDLIEKHGWYKAKNRGDNLNGISRDHKVSINYGWNNSIPPEVISHPANCQLMQYRENSSKNVKCSIDLSVLLEEIEKWNCEK